MPSASINNHTSTKLVKQTSVNSVNSGGASGTSKGIKKVSENSTKSTNTNSTAISLSNETSSLKTVKENTNNVVAAAQAQQQNNKNWETSSAAGNNTLAASLANKDAGSDALNPMKLTFTTIEHKIRNLEKRKTKLEGYLNSGKELSVEQRAAVAKYDAVMATLEFARDLVKQMQQFTKDAEKEQKKHLRKELIAKAHAETIKIREVLIMQNILSCFTDDAVRNDFLSGENGAAKLEPTEIEILEKFCLDVQTRRPETSEDAPFATSAQKAAEIFSMTIDARPKQYADSTYENVKRIFHRIQESDYLDKIYLTDVPEPETKAADDLENEVNVELEDAAAAEANDPEQEIVAVEENLEKLNLEAPAAQETSAEHNVSMVDPQQQHQQAVLKEHMELQQQVPLSNLPPPTAQAIIPTPMAPPATAVPSFQPTVPAPHSGATTPVHVAIYHPSMQQPAPQHLQQMATNAALIGNVHTHSAAQILPALTAQQLQQSGVQNLPPASSVQSNQTQQQQRQMLTSPSAGQPAVGAGPIAIHNGNPQQQPLPPGHFNPTPVHAVEQNFFKHQSQHPHQQPPQQQQQYLQQMRPLAEVIGSGNFYFLQDSELDSPDLNSQGVPQNTIVFEQQQQPHQNLQQNKPTQHVITEQTAGTQNQQQQQLQQLNQQHPLNQPQNSTPTPIQTQTFTNQSFPQMPPPPQQQQQQQQHPPNAGILQSTTPSPLFQQPPPPQQHQTQQQQQQKATSNQQIFTPVQTQNMITPHQQQQQQQQSQLIMTGGNETPQQPPPNIMILNRLATSSGPATTPLMQQQQQGILQHQQQQQQQQITPQTQNLVAGMQQQQQQLPPNPAATEMSQTATKNAGFPFENAVAAGLGYEQQMQNKLNAEKVLNAFQEANNMAATHLHKNDLINEWDEAVLKSNSSTSANNQSDFKSSPSVQIGETTSTKWSAEVNANSPITIQQTSSRKNEWTSSAASANNGNSGIVAEPASGGYISESRSESNHWESNSYGRGSSGGNRGQGGGGGGYQRQRNDDRRDDRRPGGGSGGYRGRSNYSSGNPQQNGQSRGGGGGGNSSGIYFRNNENSNNSYYQNGSGGGGGGSNVYSNKESRYDSRGGGGGSGNYRGPRGSDNNSANPRSNGPPPRHMGNRAGGSNVNNANSYMNSRQSNRMPLGIENKN